MNQRINDLPSNNIGEFVMVAIFSGGCSGLALIARSVICVDIGVSLELFCGK